MKFPKWQLHRGYWQNGVRENTMEAFQQAFEAQCEMVELDVQLSREAEVYVFHDFSLKRFFHIDQWVYKTSNQDLETLNIPKLRDVLESDRVPPFLNIEIKTIDFIPYRVAQKVCQTLYEVSHNKKVLISSFNPVALFLVKKMAPEIPRALIVGNPKTFMSWKLDWSLRWADPEFINVHYKLIDDETTRSRLLALELPVMVWTVNDLEKANFYLDRGARSVISDWLPTEN